VGVSDFASWQLAHANLLCELMGWMPISVIQSEYSILERDVEREVLPYCRAHDVGFVPYFPLASGFLTGKYRRGQAPPPGSRGAVTNILDKYMNDACYDQIEKLESWAADRDRGLNELAQAWLMAQPSVCSVISGATKLEHVLSNVKGADWVLTAEDLEEVDALLA
jgi:aryl-alcohol dehydrogenase-like predicted oxidoreductase